MKLQRNALVLLLSAAVLAGGVYFYETRKPNPDSALSGPTQPNATGQVGSAAVNLESLFKFKEEEIISLTIQTPKQTVSVEKQNGKWQMSVPQKVPANEPIVAFLTNLLISGKRDRVLAVAGDRQREFGLDQPLGIIDITLGNQQKHKVVLGGLTFDRTAMYAQIDPDSNAKDIQVSLISPQFENAVNRKLEEWKENKQSVMPSPSISPTP